MDKCHLRLSICSPSLKPLFKPMSFRRFPQRALLSPALFALVASLAGITDPVSASAQSPSPTSTSTTNPATTQTSAQSPAVNPAKIASRQPPIVAATPQKSMDWWVPGLLGASVMGAGVGMAVVLRRSQQQLVTQPPEPITYNPEPKGPAADANVSAKTAMPIAKSPVPTVAAIPAKTPVTEPVADPAVTDPVVTDPVVTDPAVTDPVIDQAVVEPATPSNQAIASQTTRMPKANLHDTLLNALHSTDPNHRQKAIWELGQRGDSRAVQPLVDLLLDSDSQQRGLVLSALSEISTRTLKPVSRALAISLQDENADVRKNAIRDLTRVYDLLTNVSQLLQSACEDPDQEVQETAKWALGQINRIKAPLIEPGPRRSVSRPETLN
jgi:HEAT repeats